MKKLVIDTFGLLEGYQRLESVLGFYPYGLKGLIVDALSSYLNGPPVLHDTDCQDSQFFEQVLQRYHESPEYRLHVLSAKNPDHEELILFVVMAVAFAVRQIVEVHGHELRQGVLDVNSMLWGPSYMLLEMRH